MTESMVEKVARAIASELGDDLDGAFENKSEWNAARGEKGGRFRDINEPFRADYIDAARSAMQTVVDHAISHQLTLGQLIAALSPGEQDG